MEYLNTLSENHFGSDVPVLHHRHLRGGAATEMERSQDEDRLPDIAATLIESRNDLNAQQRVQLAEFFRLTLQKEADLREGSLQKLIRLLGGTGNKCYIALVQTQEREYTDFTQRFRVCT